MNTSLSILNTGLTSTANIVTGQLAGAILTGGATLAGSARDHINAHVYRNTFAYAISRAITLERQRLRGLLEGRYRENPTHFTVDEAIRAANEYHGACSFYKGLELVLASVEGDQRSRDAQTRQTQLETIDREIRMQEAAMLTVKEADRGPYRTNIAALHSRRQALTLASVPVPPPAATEEDDAEEDDDAPDPPPVPAPTPSPTP